MLYALECRGGKIHKGTLMKEQYKIKSYGGSYVEMRKLLEAKRREAICLALHKDKKYGKQLVTLFPKGF